MNTAIIGGSRTAFARSGSVFADLSAIESCEALGDAQTAVDRCGLGLVAAVSVQFGCGVEAGGQVVQAF